MVLKNLQKTLLLEGMKLLDQSSWEILEESGIIAFKAPIEVPLIDFVYGEITLKAFEKVKNFYSVKPFLWLLSQNQDSKSIMKWGFKKVGETFEMELNLNDYISFRCSSDIKIQQAFSQDIFHKWLLVASEWLEMDVSLLEQFFTPWINTGKCIPFLGLWKEEPAATAIVYCGEKGAALYCIGTRTSFRCRGLGTAMTHACLEAAKSKNITRAVLYSSQMGKKVYDRIGFKLEQVISEYSYNDVC